MNLQFFTAKVGPPPIIPIQFLQMQMNTIKKSTWKPY